MEKRKAVLASEPPGHLGTLLTLGEEETLPFHFPEARPGILPESLHAPGNSAAAPGGSSLVPLPPSTSRHTPFLPFQGMSGNGVEMGKDPRIEEWAPSVGSAVEWYFKNEGNVSESQTQRSVRSGTWVQRVAPAPLCWVTLGRVLPLSVPRCPPLCPRRRFHSLQRRSP